MLLRITAAASPSPNFKPLHHSKNRIILQPRSHPLTTPSLYFFSTGTTKNPPNPSNKSDKNPNAPKPAPHKTRLDELGASPTVKLVVYTSIAILEVVETHTWGIWVWQRFLKEDEGGSETAELGGGG